jgi:hypothetical protein
MSDISSALHLFGMVEALSGPVIIGLGVLISRNPKFPSWLGLAMQFLGGGLFLAGLVAYFQPLGEENSLHAVGLIFFVTLVLVAVRFQRAQNVAKGNPQS